MLLKLRKAFFPFCAKTFLILLQPRETCQRVTAPLRNPLVHIDQPTPFGVTGRAQDSAELSTKSEEAVRMTGLGWERLDTGR